MKRILAIDSQYTLFQYLLLSSEEEINNTFIFCRNGLSKEVLSKFEGRYYVVPRLNGFLNSMYFYYRILFRFPFLFSESNQYWGCDNLGFEMFIIRHHNFHLLEDGLLSYNEIPYKWKNKRFSKLKKLIFGPLNAERKYVGEEKTCICRHMTGLIDTSIVHDSKTQVDSLDSMWKKSSSSKRELINNIFGINHKFINNLVNYDGILFTQPLSEDGYISEEEKISLYKKIIMYIGDNMKILIKPHPRETTNYNLFFPSIRIMNTKAPFQLLSLNGVHFREAYTIFSTCALDFNFSIKVFYFGSQINDKLGNIFRDNHYGSICPDSPFVEIQKIDFNRFNSL